MDPVTHTLVGAAMGQGLFRRRLGPEAPAVLMLASNLPDMDVLVHLTSGAEGITMRRGFGHSVLLFPLWSLALAWAVRRLRPGHRLSSLFWACLAGAAGHVFFDLVNSFGVQLLWPLVDWRPELAVVFIIDLVLTGLLAAPFLLLWGPWRERLLEGACRLSLAGALAYVAFCGLNRALAWRALEASWGGGTPEFAYVFPEPLGPHRWRGVALREGVYGVSLIHSLSGRVEPRGEVRTDAGLPPVRAARATARGRRFEGFFKAPVWRLTGDGEARVWDLRFRSLVLERGEAFTFTVPIP